MIEPQGTRHEGFHGNGVQQPCQPHAKGLIRKVAVPGFPDRYDNVTRHDHLVCQNCSRLVDVSLEDFTESIQRDSGAQIISGAYDLNIT